MQSPLLSDYWTVMVTVTKWECDMLMKLGECRLSLYKLLSLGFLYGLGLLIAVSVLKFWLSSILPHLTPPTPLPHPTQSQHPQALRKVHSI